MTNFISVNDVLTSEKNDSTKAINSLVEKALFYKENPFVDKALGENKKIGLLFLNPSLRTRISTQVAAKNLGMEAIVFNVDKEGWALEFEENTIMNGTSVEHVKDAAPILGSYFDILCIRTFPSLQSSESDYAETIINKFIKYAGVPVVSLESATLHPLQSLTDIVSITEVLKKNPINKKPKIVLSWAPHVKPLPQCVANSFSEWINAWDSAEFVITHPKGYELDSKFSKSATIDYDQNNAIAGADFIYIKNWSSYNDYGKMPGINLETWMLTNKKLELTNNAKIMHCLPVRRNVELSDEILDGQNSLITLQGSNRVWAAQAVLSEILNSKLSV